MDEYVLDEPGLYAPEKGEKDDQINEVKFRRKYSYNTF